MMFNLRLQVHGRVSGLWCFPLPNSGAAPLRVADSHKAADFCLVGVVGKCSSWFEKSLLGAEEQAWPCLSPFMGLISSNRTKVT